MAGTRIDAVSEERRAVRELVDFGTRFSLHDETHDLRVINISAFGLMGRVNANVRKGDAVAIELPQVGTVKAVVRWVEDGRI